MTRTRHNFTFVILAGILVLLFQQLPLPFQARTVTSIEKAVSNHDATSILGDKTKKQENHNHTWCPFATCHDSPLCEPCRQRFLVIIASGRSGSTTLQQMISKLPHVRMAGENKGALHYLKQTIEVVTKSNAFGRGASPTNKLHAWEHNEIPLGAMACVPQKFIQTINPPPIRETQGLESDTIIGFKTIRFLNHLHTNKKTTPQELQKADLDLVNFMKQHFPCTRYLVNVRSDTPAQAASVQNVLHTKSSIQDLDDYNARLKRLADYFGPQQAYFLDSSLWVHNVSLLNNAVEWLGFRNCKYDKVLEFNTQHGYFHGETELTLPPTCRYQ